MLNPKALANAAALLTAVAYLLFYAAGWFAPRVFVFIYNAQFFGANVAAMVPTSLPWLTFAGILVTLALTTWVFTYLFARLYNWLSEK